MLLAVVTDLLNDDKNNNNKNVKHFMVTIKYSICLIHEISVVEATEFETF